MIVVERYIKARPETVFTFFTDPDRWLLWQGVAGQVEARPGGEFRLDVRGDGYAVGRFLEVDPPRRLVFTWGWEDPAVGLPPGSTTVEVDVIGTDDGCLVRLTHRELPPPAEDVHRMGWTHYVERLGVRAEGGDPGPDPWRV